MRLLAYRGDTNVYNVSVVRQDAAVNLSTAKIWFTAKNDLEDADVDAVIAKNSDDNPLNIRKSDPIHGHFQVVLDPADTTELVGGRALYYDIQISEAGGIITTIVSGVLEVDRDVTLTTT